MADISAKEIVLDKIITLSDIFSCKLDALVRENLMNCDEVYSEITIRSLKGFRMARYVIISPNPEDDVNRYMDAWAAKSGLLAMNPNAKRIGWDFPWVTLLDFYGINHAERNKRISKKNPVPYEYSILTVHTNAGYTHWILLHDNQYYDPEFGLIEGEYTHGKITSFLEIYAE